jgi:hypothetical protein
LEDRLLLSSSPFIVDTTADSGPGSLRAAILSANAQPGPSTIDFNIGSGGTQTIELTSPLPVITRPVVLDGSTQPGFAGTPLVTLDGKNAGPASTGLTITAGNTTVRDLAIDRFGGSGIVLSGAGGNVISGDYIGIAPGGAAAGNGQRGIYINGSSNNTIGGTSSGSGNCISANAWSAIRIDAGGSGNIVEGNFIGTSVNGSLPMGNGAYGIRIADGNNNQIGGTTSQARNVISANRWSGVCLDGGSSANLLEGNYIGTDETGLLSLGNHERGVIESGAASNTIGGTAAGAGNVISANLWSGIRIDDGGSASVVQGNFIGTSADGHHAMGNGGYGVRIADGNGNVIGGATSEARNAISDNVLGSVLTEIGSNNEVDE